MVAGPNPSLHYVFDACQQSMFPPLWYIPLGGSNYYTVVFIQRPNHSNERACVTRSWDAPTLAVMGVSDLVYENVLVFVVKSCQSLCLVGVSKPQYDRPCLW